MAKTMPLLVGVEDTLVVAAAHGRPETQVRLQDFQAHVDALVSQGLGNLYVVRGYLLHPDADPAEMLASKRCVTDDPDGDLVKLLEYAARRGLYCMTIYTTMTRRVVSALKRRCGRFYLGNDLGEITAEAVPPGARDMRDAARQWVRRARKAVNRQWRLGQPHVTCTLTNAFAKYCLEAGMDLPMAEIFTLPSVDLHYALLRGAARAYGRHPFGGWIAAGWFNGSNRDPLKVARARLAYLAGFLHGAGIFINESGHWGLHEFRDFEGEDHPLCGQYRAMLRDFYAMAAHSPRPGCGPETRIGLVHGNLDGYAGLESEVWGQPGWRRNAHDASWDLLNVFYPNVGPAGCFLAARARRRPRFSGTPYGLVDIVPAEASARALSRYRSLLFLGWNTMTEAQYAALIGYVRAGGRLVMWASHLNGSPRHDDVDMQQRFFRNGDFRDLFGARVSTPPTPPGGARWRSERTMVNFVRWVRAGTHGFPVGKVCYINWPHGGMDSDLAPDARVLAVTDRGAPFVTERALGKGRAMLVHCYSPQGQGNYRELAEDIYHAVGRRELPAFRVDGAEDVAWAVYGRGKGRVLYALNTRLEASTSAEVVGLPGGPRRLRLAPASMARVDHA